jgi:microcystin-dependent protein
MNCSFCHNHDMFYAKKSHRHDDRYYTEGEVDALIEAIELTPGPQGPQGETGATGPQGPQPPLASQAEVDAGTVTDKAISPATLKDAATVIHTLPDTSETVEGVIELATQTEVNTGTDAVRAITPATLKNSTSVIHTLPDTSETVEGVIELATQAEVNTGTDAVRAVTPATLKNSTSLDSRYYTESEIDTKLADSNVARCIGEVIMWAGGVTPPTGWLFCQGEAISRQTYYDLYVVIGTTFGVGDGATTFNLPNFNNRVPIGSGSSYSQGATGGEATHTLTVSEIPAHGHGLYKRSVYPLTGAGGALIEAGTEAVTTQNTGGGSAHNNLPPYLGLKFLIYTGYVAP